MRDKRYIAVHRGGPLTLEHHQILAAWAADCVDHIIQLYTKHHPTDNRPQKGIEAARAWSRGEIGVGAARQAAVAAHAAARAAPNKSAEYVARAAGHAAGTAHMADHAPGAAAYALKAVKEASERENATMEIQAEFEWQLDRLPENLRELVRSSFQDRLAAFKLGVA